MDWNKITAMVEGGTDVDQMAALLARGLGFKYTCGENKFATIVSNPGP